MSWIRAHITAILLALSVPLAFVGVLSYQQMGTYNNYDTTNWLITLGWFGAAGVLAISGGATQAWMPLGGNGDGVSPSIPVVKTTAQASVAQIRELRNRAGSYRVHADGCDAEATKIIAAMEAELTAAKALVEGVK